MTSCLSVWSDKFGDIPDVLPTKQPFWDRPGVLEDKVLVDSSMNSAHHRASFLAASSQHSGDWLFALPIASCGLMLDDEAVSDSVVYATVSTQYQHYTDGQTDRNDM